MRDKEMRQWEDIFLWGKRHKGVVFETQLKLSSQGLWEDDERNGWGELTYNSGDKYRGEWLDDKQRKLSFVDLNDVV